MDNQLTTAPVQVTIGDNCTQNTTDTPLNKNCKEEKFGEIVDDEVDYDQEKCGEIAGDEGHDYQGKGGEIVDHQ